MVSRMALYMYLYCRHSCLLGLELLQLQVERIRREKIVAVAKVQIFRIENRRMPCQ